MNQSLKALMIVASELENALVCSEGELTPEIEHLLTVTSEKIPQKIDSYGHIMDSLQKKADLYYQTAKEWETIAKRFEAAQERIKENLRLVMLEHKIDELQGQRERFKMMKSSGSVKIINQNEIPENYKSVSLIINVDKKAIGDELKKGLPVPGATLEINSYVRRFASKPEVK
jgi:hypothetical protein